MSKPRNVRQLVRRLRKEAIARNEAREDERRRQETELKRVEAWNNGWTSVKVRGNVVLGKAPGANTRSVYQIVK